MPVNKPASLAAGKSIDDQYFAGAAPVGCESVPLIKIKRMPASYIFTKLIGALPPCCHLEISEPSIRSPGPTRAAAFALPLARPAKTSFFNIASCAATIFFIFSASSAALARTFVNSATISADLSFFSAISASLTSNSFSLISRLALSSFKIFIILLLLASNDCNELNVESASSESAEERMASTK